MNKKYLTLVLLLSIKLSSFGCTGGVSVGLPANNKTIVAGTLDWHPPINLSLLKAKLVTPKNGNKFLRIAFGGQPGDGACLNDKGVGYKDFSRLVKLGPKATNIDQDKVSEKLLAESSSAKDFIKRWEPILTKSGCGQDRENNNGWAMLLCDTKEAYLIEASDALKDNAVTYTHAIQGPFKNTIFAQANYFIDSTMRAYQKNVIPNLDLGGLGYSRARRMWNLLAAKQMYNIEKDKKNGYIDVAYWMDVLRDRGSVNDNNMLDSNYVTVASGKQGKDAICKNIGVKYDFPLTYCAQIVAPSVKCPDYLSVVWSGLGFPLTSPYLPFYIGVNKLPKSVESGTDKNSFAYIFNELYNKVFIEGKEGKIITNNKRLDEVSSFWRKFDKESLAKSKVIEEKVIALNNIGKQAESTKLLNKFLEERTSLAIKQANAFLKEFNSD